MKFAEIIHHRASKTLMAVVCLTANLFTAPLVCFAQQKTEHDAASRLISMVESGELGQSAQAQKLFRRLRATSHAIEMN